MTIELEKSYYKIKELSEILNVSDDTIRRRMKLLQIIPVGDSRPLLRLHKTQAQRLVDWITRQKEPKKDA